LTKLILDTNIVSILRTHQQQEVQVTARAILDRVASDPVFAPLLNSYIYATLHHYRPRFDPLDWQVTPEALLAGLADEPRASILLKGPYLSAEVHLHLNCEDEIIQEKVDGKRRKVPKPSPASQASADAGAARFASPTFTQAYLDLVGDMFEIIGGEYGHADHLAIRHGTEFDRMHRSPYEPTFITWANFFGPELVARFGRGRLLSTAAHEVRELRGGSIVLTVAASPLDQLEPQVQERIGHLKAHLGILSPSERATPGELAAFEAGAAGAEAAMKRRVEEAFRQAREQTADEMQRQAEGCVEAVQQFWGERLDFSPQSLAVVDRLIQTGFRPEEDEETVATAVQAFGSYVGEVVRRTLGGVWHDEQMRGQPVLLSVGSRKIRVEPFLVVRERLEQQQGGEGDLVAWYGKW
jgi:hypothetical protein